MSVESDLKIIAKQEEALVFERFDEDVAFLIGAAAREAGRAFGKGIAVGVYLWDRTLFFGATAGATEANRGWVERKAKLVKLLLKSSYRIVLERGDQPRLLEPSWAIEPSNYAIAGGAFPISVRGLGVAGAAVVSGLNERDDHEVARAAIARALGKDSTYLALPAV